MSVLRRVALLALRAADFCDSGLYTTALPAETVSPCNPDTAYTPDIAKATPSRASCMPSTPTTGNILSLRTTPSANDAPHPSHIQGPHRSQTLAISLTTCRTARLSESPNA